MEKKTSHRDIGDVSASLKALFMQPTHRELYRALSREAATLERGKHYITAMQQWVAASQVASADVDRHWCEARAHLCERRARLISNAE